MARTLAYSGKLFYARPEQSEARFSFLASASGRRIPVSPLTLAVPPPARKPTPQQPATLPSQIVRFGLPDNGWPRPSSQNGGLLRTQQEQDMNEPTGADTPIINAIHQIKLEVSEDRVFVEIDGLKGEVTLGQAREVREMLAHAAVEFIQNTTRSRRAELDYLAGSVAEGASLAPPQARRRDLSRSFSRY
jgi:hypothetical protein